MKENGNKLIESFDEYKKLTTTEERFYIFIRLQKIDSLCDKFDGLEKRYAFKWVEQVMRGGIVMVLVAFFSAIIALVIKAGN